MSTEGQGELDMILQESAERMAVVELLAKHLAVGDCDTCIGDGLDYEGNEWTLCECVLAKADPLFSTAWQEIPVALRAAHNAEGGERCDSTLMGEQCELDVNHDGNCRVESRANPGMFHRWSRHGTGKKVTDA